MSNVDATWLHMDDPTNLMMVSGILYFDRAPEFERIRTLVEERLLRFDRFRQRVIEGALGGPTWQIDLGFDLDNHLTREELPAPGDDAVLKKRVGELMSTPLDPKKPLWHFTVMDGYRDGGAIVCRFHHCIADGIAMIYVMLSIMDESPEGELQRLEAPPAKPDLVEKGSNLGVDSMLRGFGRAVGRTWSAAGSAVEEGIGLFAHPHKTLDLAALALSGAGALTKLLTLPVDSPTSMKGPLSVEKVCAWSDDYPLPRVKEIARVLGGTINDVLVTAAAGALRRYLSERGEETEGVEVRAMLPVNLRPLEEASRLGNHFGLVYLTMPAGIEDPFDRFHETKSRMDEIKRSPEALIAFQILKALGTLPKGGTKPIVDMFAKKATAVMTNVPGPRQPIYLAGAKLTRTMFWVPRSGRLGLGISIISYNGAVHIGIAADKGLIPEPQRIADGFNEELESMMELVEAPKRDEKPRPDEG